VEVSYISFPYLNLKFEIGRVAFTIGNKDIYWYGIIIAIGFLVAVVTAVYLSKKVGLKKDTILDVVLFAAPVSIIGARAYYVAFRWEYYGLHPEEIVQIWNGGIAIYGAILCAIAVTVIYCRVKKENLGLVCDVGSIGLAIGQCIGRWGNFVNQEAFGINTTLPWAMTGDEIQRELADLMRTGVPVDPTLPVHPTFLYESLWNVAIIVILISSLKKRKFDGQIFFGYVTLYGIGRFWIEGLRTDSLTAGNFRVSQIVSVLFVIIGIVAIITQSIKSKKIKSDTTEEILQKNL